ncbi:MAG: dicarboxylate/amino acid:cation symporter [Planctomycetota bacterium]|nr:MAG: dicarboxylate/amino acid:cation symporter [Planctomycetota bacterium]
MAHDEKGNPSARPRGGSSTLPEQDEEQGSQDAAPNSSAGGDGGRIRQGIWARLVQWPLYWRILIGMLLGAAIGVVAGEHAEVLRPASQVILQLLGALAPPLILVAVVHVLMTSDIPRSSIARLIGLLILNTSVAIFIGLVVANLLQPGKWIDAGAVPQPVGEAEEGGLTADPLAQLLGNVPRSLLGPLGDSQNVIGVIIIAVAFGIALRKQKDREIRTTSDLVEVAYQSLLTVLHWIIELVPIGVLCVVAPVVGTQGFGAFLGLGAFVVAVVLALCLQTVWYLARIQLFSWVSPWRVLVGMRDALVMAFSTDSSTATMPVTYACLREKVGLRERSASLGALVGANFNNDGTALYEAMAALFVAQMIGMDLDLSQQLTVVLTSILASVGAAGIPEAGIVTMTLVFQAVGLPIEHIPLLLTVDWFLDRCRTTINVMGDVNVSCLLDGRQPPDASELVGEMSSASASASY